MTWSGFKEAQATITRSRIVWIKDGYAVGHHPDFGFSVLQVSPYDCLARHFESEALARDYVSTLDPRPDGLHFNKKGVKVW